MCNVESTKCPVCKKQFNKKTPFHKYCSIECRDKTYIKPKAVLNRANCRNCGKSFHQKRVHQVYCDKECSKEFHDKKNVRNRVSVEREIICSNCGCTFISKFLRKYCNDQCAKEFYKKRRDGAKSTDTLRSIVEKRVSDIFEKAKVIKPKECLGVIISEFTLDSFSEKIKNEVRKRDNYCCRVCEVENESLEVHHILKRKLGGSNEIDNLITLCIKCHRAIETSDKEHAVKACYKNAEKIKGRNIGDKLTYSEKINILTSCLEEVFKNINNEKGFEEKEMLLKINNALSITQ